MQVGSYQEGAIKLFEIVLLQIKLLHLSDVMLF